MANLAGRAKNRIAAQRLSGKLAARYEGKAAALAGTVAGRNLAMVNGRLVQAAGLDSYAVGDAVTLSNVGTPGMAAYAPAGNNLAVQFVGGGAATGGGGVTDHGELSGLNDDDHPHYLTPERGDALYVPLARQVVAGAGMTGGGELTADITVSVGAGEGLQVGTDAIGLRSDVAGAGLAYNAGVLSVTPGEGLEIETDAIGLKASVAGDGLTYATGVINVAVANTGAAALTVEANAVRLTTSSSPGASAKALATDAAGGLYLDTNLLAVDAPNNRVGVNRLPGGAALDVVAANNADHTQRLTQKAGQTGRIWRVEDASGQELIVLTAAGDLQSGNPGFISGLTGWRITSTGIFEAAHAWIRGEFHASIFSMDEFHSSGGTLFIAPAGVLENDAVLTTETTVGRMDVRTTNAASTDEFITVRTTNATSADAYISARAVTNYLDITDPASGHATVFAVGDRLRCKSQALGVGLHVYDVWMEVTAILDMTDYYRYYVRLIRGSVFGGGFGYPTLPAGAAVINYRKAGDGMIVMTADQQDAPYMQIFISGEEPWNDDIRPVVRQGSLNGVGLPGIKASADDKDYGIVFGADLSDASQPYFIGSDKRLKSYRIENLWNDGENDTGRIGPDGSLAFGTNIGQAATTGLSFDPLSGDVTIGSPTYNGQVKVYGQIFLPDGEEVESVHWRGGWGAGINYRRQDAVSWAGRSWIAVTAHTSFAGNVPTVGSEWQLMADQGQDGQDGAPGSSAKLASLVASSEVFAVNTSGAATPSSITLSASGQNVAGSPSFAITAGTGWTLTGTGDSRSLAYASGGSDSVTITATWDGVSDTVTIVKVRDGAAGAPGAPGAHGLTVVLSNEAHTLPASSAGVASSYAGSGTTVRVWEGATALAAAATANADGTFAVGTISVSPAGAISPGAVSASGTTITIADHASMSNAVTLASVTIPITVRRQDGTVVTINKVQTLTKSIAGANGQSVAAQYSADGSTWHAPPFEPGDLYMRQSVDGGSTWSNAMRIVGENGSNGDPGADGNYIRYVFKRAPATPAPATPTGDNLPSTWFDAPPTADADPLWMSKATQTPSNVTVGAWSTPVRITGDSGANAKGVKLTASALIFAVDASWIATPSAITLSAAGQNVVGVPSFAVTTGTATLTGADASRTLSYANMVSDLVTITVTWDGVTDSVSIAKVREGEAGADGTDGLPALTVVLSNEAHTVPASSAGVVGSYLGSGTSVEVYEGATALAAGGSADGSFTVALADLRVNVRSTNNASTDEFITVRSANIASTDSYISTRTRPVTPGAITYVGNTAVIGDHSAWVSSQNVVSLTWQIAVKRLTGQTVILTKTQTLTKSLAGQTGATGQTGPTGADNQDFPFLEADAAALAGKPAGMFMVNDYVGHWTGTAFDMYMGVGPADGNGVRNAEFRFGGSGAAQLGYAGGKLRGLDSGGMEQWYASSIDGALVAGAGAVRLDLNGERITRPSWTDLAGWPEPLSVVYPLGPAEAAQAIQFRDTAAGPWTWTNSPSGTIAYYSYPANTTLQIYASSRHYVPSLQSGYGWDHYIDGVIETPAISGAGEPMGSYNRRLWLRSPTIYMDGNVVATGTLKVGTNDVYHAGNLPPFAATSHTHEYSAASHTHEYAATSHTHSYAATSHTHPYAPTASPVFTAGPAVSASFLRFTSVGTTAPGYSNLAYGEAMIYLISTGTNRYALRVRFKNGVGYEYEHEIYETAPG